MRTLVCILWLLGSAAAAGGEIIDRIALTVGNIVVTESELLERMRIAAFLNGEAPDLSAAARRKAAEHVVEYALIRREMEISRYPAPEVEEARKVLGELRAARFREAGSYETALKEYGISESALINNLLQQLVTLRFIEVRFRPAVAVDEREVRDYYQNRLLAEWNRPNEAPPSFEDARDQLERVLEARLVDAALDRWMAQQRGQARIVLREEAFQ